MKFDKNTIGFVVLVAILLVSGVISLGLFRREMTAHDRLDVHTFPMTVGRDERATLATLKSFLSKSASILDGLSS